jgi:tRNA(fMet)-specific endonuclease VapC
MKRLLLDTNAYSDLARGKIWNVPVRAADRVYLPLPALAELRFGFLNGTKSRENEVNLSKFLSISRVKILCPDENTASHYASTRLQLKSKGVAIPVNDLWIAALAIQHGLWLCTSDAHFDHIPQLLRASS